MNIRDLFGTFAPKTGNPPEQDPLFNRREAGWHLAGGALQGLGTALMTGNMGQALQVNNAALPEYKAMKKEKYTAQRLMEEAEAKKQERERTEMERKRKEDYINTLPADVRMKAMSIPGYLDSWIAANDPSLQQAQEPKRYNVGGSLVDADGNVIYQGQEADTNSITGQIAERQMAAESMGLTPEDPAYKSYILTGKMPREDQSPLSATDKKAILEADEAVLANTNVIQQLESVIKPDASGKSINDRAGFGVFADAQSWLARNDAKGIFDDAKGQATTELKNIVLNQALSSLKTIFGSAPTEGERQILIDLQASVDKTPKERESIIRRAITAAKARLKFNEERAAGLRGGSYYKPGGGGPATSADGITIELFEE
jgi:hypothetical protein